MKKFEIWYDFQGDCSLGTKLWFEKKNQLLAIFFIFIINVNAIVLIVSILQFCFNVSMKKLEISLSFKVSVGQIPS